MASHILASTGVKADASWSERDLLNAYSILPAPKVSFQLWCARTDADRITEEEATELNETGDKALDNMIKGAA